MSNADTGQELLHKLNTNKVLTKQSINQTKAEKIAEWERLPIGTLSQQTGWLHDRLSLVNLIAEKSAQQSRSYNRPQVQRSASSSDLQQQPFLQPGFVQGQDKESYASPTSGTSDGSATRDSNLMMPPPARPVNIGKGFTSSPESTSSTSFVTYSTPTQQPSENWRNANTPMTTTAAAAATTQSSSWLRLQDPDQSHMSSSSAERNRNDSPTSEQTPSASSRAQQLSSSQWRRFF